MRTRRTPILPKPSLKERILEHKHALLHSVLRKIAHIRTFDSYPRTSRDRGLPPTLKRPENQAIRTAFLCLAGSDTPVFRQHMEHWTTHKNLRSIIKHGAFLGNTALRKNTISFNANLLTTAGVNALDGNVICFTPGLVNPNAFIHNTHEELKPDMLVLRLDGSKIHKAGKYNLFFKLTDLCGQSFEKTIVISPFLEIVIKRDKKESDTQPLMVEFKLKTNDGTQTGISIIEKENCIFYGNLEDIRYFCLKQMFVALESCQDESLRNKIYQHLNTLNQNALKQVILTFAQSLTLLSELNVQGYLALTRGLIQNVHFLQENKTFELDNTTAETYQAAAKRLSGPAKRILPLCKKEVVVNVESNEMDWMEFEVYKTPVIYLYEQSQSHAKYQFERTDLSPLSGNTQTLTLTTVRR